MFNKNAVSAGVGMCLFKNSTRASFLCVLLACSASPSILFAQYVDSVRDVVVTESSGGVQVRLDLDGGVSGIKSFEVGNPRRIVFDLPGTKNMLASKSVLVNKGPLTSIRNAEDGGRTRLVFEVDRDSLYDYSMDGGDMIINIMPRNPGAASSTATSQDKTLPVNAKIITAVDFNRENGGDGIISFQLSSKTASVSSEKVNGGVLLSFDEAAMGESVPSNSLNFEDFMTPVKTVSFNQNKGSVTARIAVRGSYEYTGDWHGDKYVVRVKDKDKISKANKAPQNKPAPKQESKKNELITLNFADVEVRSVLQIISDFTGINVVASDSVKGSITLRLQNVPWQEALSVVLKTKGLDMRKHGNIIMVAPVDEIAARERLELESRKQIEDLSPVSSKFFRLNYAKAEDVASLITKDGASVLSDRGSVSVDARTNTIMINDVLSVVENVKGLISELDIPVKQVLIESRIVIANNDFAEDLGVKFGLSGRKTNGSMNYIMGGGMDGDIAPPGGVVGIQKPGDSSPGMESLLVNLPIANPAGSVNFMIGKVGTSLLRLELAAMQSEGKGEIISSPRVITSNQSEASIVQGVQIPYLESTSSGAASVSFKEAVLGMKVTPQITPDDNVIMNLKINKDSVGQVFANVPSINTREIATQVLVGDGETVVLGGVYENTQRNEVDKVPLLGDLPVLGRAFRTDRSVNDKSELLIFVTPKIVEESAVM